MKDVAAPQAAETPPLPVILFTGREEKARAATFPAEEAEVAERAAATMGLRVLRITTDEHRLIAASLAHGKTYAATQKALVPFCRGQIVAQLNACPEAFTPAPPADAEPPAKPPQTRKGRPLAATEGEVPHKAPEPASAPAKADAPTLVPVGAYALAAEEADVTTWYPARVTAQRGPELLVLQWVDGGDTIVRRRDHLVPFPPALAGKLK